MTNAEINAKFEQLNPENKKKAIKMFYQLLEEQTAEEGGAVYLYFFECLDAALGDKYFTACELNEMVNGIYAPMPERDIKRIAANYEATLYRYEKSPAGDPINETCLYDCFDM